MWDIMFSFNSNKAHIPHKCLFHGSREWMVIQRSEILTKYVDNVKDEIINIWISDKTLDE